MEFGIQTRGGWEHNLSVAKWAEGRGDIVAIALPDHYLQRGDTSLPAWDHLVHLAGLARETSLELLSMVSPVTFRHPAVLYKMGVTLDEISGGRFTLGLGAGWMDEEFEMFGLPYPELSVRMEMLEEAMAYLRAAIEPGSRGFEGTHYSMADFEPGPQPKNLRLMIGGAGKPKGRRIVARYADEFNLYARPVAEYRQVKELTEEAMSAAGRDPASVRWTSASPGLAARKESDYRMLLGEMAKLTGQSTDRIEEVYERRGYPHGSGSKPAEMIAALEEAGCERFFPQLFTLSPSYYDVVIEAYAGG